MWAKIVSGYCVVDKIADDYIILPQLLFIFILHSNIGMSHKAKLLYTLFALALITLSNGQNCSKAALPFAKELVGKVFAIADSCYRPRSSTAAVAWKSMIEVEPAVGLPLGCSEKISFHIRKPGKVPYITVLPRMFYSGDLEAINKGGDRVLNAWCKKNQLKKKKQYWAKWESKSDFVKSLKRMIEVMKSIRDYTCDIKEPPVEDLKRKLENSKIQGLISYLISVAYEYELCIE